MTEYDDLTPAQRAALDDLLAQIDLLIDESDETRAFIAEFPDDPYSVVAAHQLLVRMVRDNLDPN